jgi:hypothetical protein
MLNKINIKISYAGIVFIFLMLVFLLPDFAIAATLDTGIDYAEDIGLGADDPRIIIAKIIRVVLGFLGIIAVALIMYAGWLYMSSGGEEAKVEQAKTVLKNALIGLIIILSAFGIVSFILSRLIGLIDGSGVGPGGGPGGGGMAGGSGALGACSIESVYPEPNQTIPEVSRNTSIIITFKEEVDPATICNDAGGNANGICDTGEYIIADNVKLFHSDQEDDCMALGGTCSSLVSEINVITNDNKTFILMPENYLGSPSENIWHTAYLSNNILKKDGSSGIFDDCYTDYFKWSFRVSNKVDLTPPIIKNNGVYPIPDNESDNVSVSSSPVQATGKIIVRNNPKVYTVSGTSSPNPIGGSSGASVSGSYLCSEDGTITASIVSGTPNTVSVSGVVGVVSGDDVSDNVASLGCGLTLSPDSGSFTVGDSWEIPVVSEKTADNLTIGSTVYTFISDPSSGNNIQVGADINETALNINTALATHSEIDSTLSGSEIFLTAKVAGVSGNNILLSSSSLYSASALSNAFEIEAMTGGVDSVAVTSINDKKDKPRNVTIQVNFNEAILPISLSGTADEVKDSIRVVNYLGLDGEACSKNQDCASDNCVSNVCSGVSSLLGDGSSCSEDRECKSFKCDSGICSGDYLAGKFAVSNLYRTVEFISDNKCGVNACGESIYCLPENSRLKVEITASELASCSNDTECATRSPYNTCEACDDCNTLNKACRNSGLNYPMSDSSSLIGVMDVSLNSLDGNRDDDSDGPASYFNENSPVVALGDNFVWSFYINDKIDLSPPTIISTKQVDDIGVEGYLNNGAGGANLNNPIIVEFSKLMMSKSLRTGDDIINNGKDDVRHKLINLWSLSSQPLGYWIKKENIDDSSPLDGEPDFTEAFITHSLFSDSTAYRAQVGSGVKDIYQNCYKPSVGPSCTGVDASNPSCCSGVVSSGSECP